ncbi:hypothetical protein DICPUDRAFT_50733 [Dictyostelium purpureum]|uniref:LIM zinc-binding domain-containing protein n=1 Tax=Dictyostelium purpureum TaxID=5786 RepID=F1A005_DICPU|nr:uncharacterized protein DICPUDRAFT_50733 [Dictyostelium purpureum]EGC30469.1 hypothetical protein DICPUDRAFT_50733 [Dictyostelium purpureum]|eukprot:XP_003292998.1 hypothetical protein DICPUDRAFT_50733 [Dictyostelium purpureum]
MVIIGTQEKCTACTKTVYLTEKIVVEDKEDKKIFHKLCLKCSHCKLTLSLGNYASMNGVFFCKPHFKQLFATKGNYDEGFGNTKHTEKWTPQATPTGNTQFIKVEETKVTSSDKKETPSGIASRFSGSLEKCDVCSKTVYITEKVVIEDKEDKKVLHKQCLKCTHCQVTLNLGTYASMKGVYYCKPHFKQLFATKGNYDESFGNAKHTEKWNPSVNTAPSSFIPVEKANNTEKNTNQSSNPELAKKFGSANNSEKCSSCQKSVYLTEKVVLEETDNKRIFHKACLKCSKCNVILTLGTLVQLEGIIFCKPHFKELYATKGNLDEGFGKPKHSEKWENNPFPYLEKDSNYVPSVEKVEQQIQSNTSSEADVDRFRNINNDDSVSEKLRETHVSEPEPVEEETKAEEPVEEETKVEEPVEEEIKVEEPVVAEEEPVEEPVAVEEETKVEEPVAAEEEKTEEPVVAEEESNE